MGEENSKAATQSLLSGSIVKTDTVVEVSNIPKSADVLHTTVLILEVVPAKRKVMRRVTQRNQMLK